MVGKHNEYQLLRRRVKADSRRSGARYRIGGSTECGSASDPGRHLTSIAGQRDAICRYLFINRQAH